MLIKTLMIALLTLATTLAQADTASTDPLAHLQQSWAEANYSVNEKAKVELFEHLLAEAEAAVKAGPQRNDLLVWRGIIKSSYAGVKGGLGALSLVKSAKADFEQAIKRDAQTLNGSAYTSLGYLYAKVPGWPIGFGSDKKAKALLQKGLEMSPNGIDSNYFYGMYLLDKGDYTNAKMHLTRAQSAPDRAKRASADKGRRQEIHEALARLQTKIAAN